MSLLRSHTLAPVLSLCIAAGLSVGCVEDGAVPECPSYEEGLGGDGNFDEDLWRSKAEPAGCVTPIGGSDHGGAGSD